MEWRPLPIKKERDEDKAAVTRQQPSSGVASHDAVMAPTVFNRLSSTANQVVYRAKFTLVAEDWFTSQVLDDIGATAYLIKNQTTGQLALILQPYNEQRFSGFHRSIQMRGK